MGGALHRAAMPAAEEQSHQFAPALSRDRAAGAARRDFRVDGPRAAPLDAPANSLAQGRRARHHRTRAAHMAALLRPFGLAAPRPPRAPPERTPPPAEPPIDPPPRAAPIPRGEAV